MLAVLLLTLACADCPKLVGPPAPPDPVVWNSTIDLAGVGRAHRLAWWACGAAGADFAVTELVIARGGEEANPIMRNRTVRVVGTVGSCAALHLVADHHPKAARVLSWVGIGLRAVAIGWNVYQVAK